MSEFNMTGGFSRDEEGIMLNDDIANGKKVRLSFDKS